VAVTAIVLAAAFIQPLYATPKRRAALPSGDYTAAIRTKTGLRRPTIISIVYATFKPFAGNNPNASFGDEDWSLNDNGYDSFEETTPSEPRPVWIDIRIWSTSQIFMQIHSIFVPALCAIPPRQRVSLDKLPLRRIILAFGQSLTRSHPTRCQATYHNRYSRS
jgi:hypothetical protein